MQVSLGSDQIDQVAVLTSFGVDASRLWLFWHQSATEMAMIKLFEFKDYLFVSATEAYKSLQRSSESNPSA